MDPIVGVLLGVAGGLVAGAVIGYLWARARASADTARAQARADFVEQRAKELETFLSRSREELKDAFASLSQEALKASTQSFLTVATEKLGQSTTEASKDLEAKKKEIETLVAPLKENLVKLSDAATALDAKRERAYGSLEKMLDALDKETKGLRSQTTALATSLRGSSQARGRWGEVQLRNIIEIAGMVEHCDFVSQESVGDGQRPDVIVRLPGDRRIAIDAKAPLTAFLDACEAADDAARAAALKAHAARLREHVKSLSARAYWDKLGTNVELVVMFLPGDSFLAAAHEVDAEIWESSIRNKVLIATPVTLIALLRTFALNWEQEALARNAKEIGAAAAELYSRVANFVEPIDAIGDSLRAAVESYNQAVGSFERRIVPFAKTLRELGAAANAKKAIPEPKPVDTPLRELQSGE